MERVFTDRLLRVHKVYGCFDACSALSRIETGTAKKLRRSVAFAKFAHSSGTPFANDAEGVAQQSRGSLRQERTPGPWTAAFHER